LEKENDRLNSELDKARNELRIRSEIVEVSERLNDPKTLYLFLTGQVAVVHEVICK